ncbi:MAG TPA: DUF5723 family protein [Pedobacter sp.]|uniref:DUF5723 family protein n=1 Tax=Pedobacter sp. TaxID=1411316 RepID=UPI002BE2AACB|nr:DUF5723 family protein [Pedobacter sp.]HMI05598.1 DUF5723 family protein [Pedobacter sp.]
MMIRKCLTICFLLLCFNQLKAQQYGLFNTKTLFDGFENPAQKTFVLDSSRQFASNFLLPYFGIHAVVRGNENVLRTLLKEGVYTTADVPLNTGKVNSLFQHTNIYLLNFKLFKSYKYHKEIGLSWQLRADAQVDYTNETLAIFDNYLRFYDENNKNFNNALNDRGYSQSYHQFSLSYRENYNKKLAFGVKLSLLSGISYNKINIDNSFLTLESGNGPMIVGLKGSYATNFQTGKQLGKSIAPFFKNPGAAISLGTSYSAKSGIFIMANIKDLGLIRWSKSSYVNNFNNLNDPLVLDSLDEMAPGDIENAITGVLTKGSKNYAFYSATNAKADFMISKTYGFYTPGLIVSKNIFHKGGEVAMVNRFYNRNFSVNVVPAYNLYNFLQVGMQGMYQTPNFEVFLGSDNLFKTTSLLVGKNDSNSGVSKAYNSASVYLGASIKFGYVVEHPQNSSYMPGVGDDEQSFFKRMFSLFKNGKK